MLTNKKILKSADNFIIVGENIHCTRVVKKGGIFSETRDDGTEGITYKNTKGESIFMEMPQHFKATQPYQQGQLKHFMFAIWKGLNESDDSVIQGRLYVENAVARQISSGANFLDLNVDEYSYRLDEQCAAMKWLVGVVEKISPVPPSIDSSKLEIIESGLSTYNGSCGRPMLNSVALERLDALDLGREHDARIIVTAAKENGMPTNEHERVDTIGRILEVARSKGFESVDIYVDPLFFPIAVSNEYGLHALNAIKMIRREFGKNIHITGGMSNISFGLPKRKLINEVFVRLAIEHGADSGIIDPVQTRISRVFDMDMSSRPVKIARDMLMGQDEFCVNYISAFRSGNLEFKD